jgi:signal transduction histidine kinase
MTRLLLRGIVPGMAAVAETIVFPVERRRNEIALSDRAIAEFAAADSVESGLERVGSLLGAHVSWSDETGTLVVSGGRWTPAVTAVVNRLAPIVRRRTTDEQLAFQVGRLARRNEALEDFAWLVAHELKAPLYAGQVEDALDLVDALLAAARAESAVEAYSSPADSLEGALRDLDASAAEISADLPEQFPLPESSLRVLLKNLVANAIAAGAHHVDIASLDSCTLVVDDDGAGLDGDYASGSGVGLGLITRLVRRHGGTVELRPRPTGGTRAVVQMACA